ncbi:replication protein A 70 kDa DNA-binding subunit B, partial [Tanacetum coccineum]
SGGYGGYGSSKGFGGSGGSGSSGGSGGCYQKVLFNHILLFIYREDSNKKITPIIEVDPMLDNIVVQGRCISIWYSHRLNAAHDPYSLDLVLQDAQNFRCYLTDVIGSVVGIGDIVPVMSAAGKKVRRTVVTEDAEGNRLDFTFWDNWATIWDEYAMNPEAMGHVVFILNIYTIPAAGTFGTPAIHNALFGSKIFINRDLPEIAAFRTVSGYITAGRIHQP